MRIQRTDWGEIQWLEEERAGTTGMKSGIVTLCPGAVQAPHVHYGEQVIYVIQGQARSTVNGKEQLLKAGELYQLEAGIEHTIENVGSAPFRHVLVSNPSPGGEELRFFPEKKLRNISPDLIYGAVEGIRTQFLDALHYGYAIFDSMGNLIVQSATFPEYCVRKCDPGNNRGTCPCMRQLSPSSWTQERVFTCGNGMEVSHRPIFLEEHFLGYIQGGYFRHSGAAAEKLENVYDAPDSVAAGVQALLKRIAKAVRNFCEFESFRRELMEKELTIASHREAQDILMRDLRDTRYAMTDLKINNHFLFNALNGMAAMALDGGMMELYRSIVNLSKMFHYTLRIQSAIVPMEKEVAYVRAYLQLQKLRYGENLEIECHVAEKTLALLVPFNFLQPVVENAFTHGFHELPRKRLRLEIRLRGQRLEIRVLNNAPSKMPKQQCRAINQGSRSNTAHGLAMIYQKLLAVYGEAFVFEICSARSGETCFRIILPAQNGPEKEGR